jgi:[ribosomal protein S5]-alanine N-acetyltransferase
MNLDVGNGIRLTDVRRSDKDALVELLNNREIHDRTLRIPFPYTASDAEQWLAGIDEAIKNNEPSFKWAIRDERDRLFGGIGFDGLIIGESHRAEIGYWLGQPFWNRGIMTAAVQTVCRHAFKDLGLAKITAHVFGFNDASRRVVEKCGFELEGCLRKHFVKDGQYLDVRAYGLIRGECAD